MNIHQCSVFTVQLWKWLPSCTFWKSVVLIRRHSAAFLRQTENESTQTKSRRRRNDEGFKCFHFLNCFFLIHFRGGFFFVVAFCCAFMLWSSPYSSSKVHVCVSDKNLYIRNPLFVRYVIPLFFLLTVSSSHIYVYCMHVILE